MNAVIFTGSRKWTRWDVVNKVIEEHPADTIVIHGAAEGLDSIVNELAKRRNMTIIPCPAQWDTLGKSAGPKRNIEMLNILISLQNCGYEVSVEAFPLEDSIGTKHMIKIAKEKNIKVREAFRVSKQQKL